MTSKNDIICVDTGKTRIENDLDCLYGEIMIKLENIMVLCGLEKDFIDKKLNNMELLQTELDCALMDLIGVIKYKE